MEYWQPILLTVLIVWGIYVALFTKKKDPCFIEFNETGKHDHTVRDALTMTDLSTLKYDIETLKDKHGTIEIYQEGKNYKVNYTFSNGNLTISVK